MTNFGRSNAPRAAVFAASVVILLCAVSAARAGEEVPAWLKQAMTASSSAQAFGREVPAVVLHDESKITVGEDGRVLTTNYYAVRILTREGRGAASAREVYRTDTGKVREMRAWLVPPQGETRRYGKDQTIDIAVADNDVYNEARARVIKAADEAEPGAVFGYEAVVEDRSIFTQFEWMFQSRLPTLVSRYSFVLPANWKAESVTFNHRAVEPTVSGGTYTWELRDLPFIKDEPASPEVTRLAPRLAVNVLPAAGAKAQTHGTFAGWGDVSRWLYSLSEGQAELDDPLAAKARDLTANAKTELERLTAIGRYAQAVNYISIQTGVGRGGGYRPRPAIEVFAKSYGDCKDKANLMRAMLKAVKIQSYLVSIYSGDPTYVREEWASPQQFNHCIIAIKVSDETNAPTVINHPALGRLLIFDPTDENTPLGDLPDHEQGSLALIVAGADGGLARMPLAPPEANLWERTIDATLTAEGGISGTVREIGVGQAAVEARRQYRRRALSDFNQMIERWVARNASGASATRIEPADDQSQGKFALNVDFQSARYAQSMRSRLLVFSPAVIPRRDSLDLSAAERKHPLVLESQAFRETTRIKLPDGFEVDEIPEDLQLDSPFGKYAADFEVKDGHLSFTRTLTVRAATVPVERYGEVRDFFGRVRGVEQSPVVLARK